MAEQISRELAAELHRLSNRASEIGKAAFAISTEVGALIQRNYIDPATAETDSADEDAFCLDFIEEAENAEAVTT